MTGTRTYGLIFTVLFINLAFATPLAIGSTDDDATLQAPKPQGALSPYKGKVALVTGASHGIGAKIAEVLVKEGLTVVGASRHIDNIKALALKLKGQPGRLLARKLDITNETEVIDTVKWIDSELGGLTVLINDAGAFLIKPIYEHTLKEMRTMIDINVLGTSLTIREAVNSFIKRKIPDGYIININSIAGHRVPYYPNVNFGLYPAAKHAITAIGETLRQALHDAKVKVRVTSISPGATATEPNVAKYEDNRFDQFLSTEDVAKTVAFSLSLPLTAEVTELTIRPTGEVQ